MLIDQVQEENWLIIRSIKIQNFKCFQQDVLIGPFRKLNAIIGPNGTGKSTILEAIDFIMCSDLFLEKKIYDYSQIQSVNESSKNITVQLDLIQNHKIQIFQRNLNSLGEFQYNMNEWQISQQIYLEELKAVNLLPICILKQEKRFFFTQLNPAQLMNYIERVSGSLQYERQYIQLQKQLKNFDQQIQEKSECLKDFNKEKRILNINIVQQDGAQNLFDQQDKLINDIFNTKIQIQTKQLIETNKKFEETFREKTTLEQQLNHLETNNDIYNKEELIQKQIKSLKSDFSQNSFNIAKFNQDLFTYQRISLELDNDIKIYQKDLQILYMPKLEVAIMKRREIQMSIDQLEQQITEIKNYSQQKNDFKINEEILYQIDHIDNKFHRVDKEKQQLLMITSQLNDSILKKWSQINKSFQEIQMKQQIEDTKKSELIDIEQQLKQLMSIKEQNQIEKKKDEQLNSQIQDQIQSRNLMEMKMNQKIINEQKQGFEKELDSQLKKRISSYLGIFKNLIEPLEQRMTLAIGLQLSKYLDYLVIQKESDLVDMSWYLTERRLQKNIIILNNLPSTSTNQLTTLWSAIQPNTYLTYDCIQSKIQSSKLQDFLITQLKNNVICEDLSTALQLSQQNSHLKIATIQGEQISSQGIEAYGSKDFLQPKVLSFIQIQNNSQANYQQEIDQINNQIAYLQSLQRYKQSQTTDEQISQVNSRLQDTDLFVKNIKQQIKNLKLQQANNEEELASQENMLIQKQQEINQLQENINQLELNKKEICQNIMNQYKGKYTLQQVIDNVNRQQNQTLQIIRIQQNIEQSQSLLRSIDVQQIENEILLIQNITKSKENEIISIQQKLIDKKNSLTTLQGKQSETELKINEYQDQLDKLKLEFLQESQLKSKLEKNIQRQKQQVIEQEKWYNKQLFELIQFIEDQEMQGQILDSNLRTFLRKQKQIEQQTENSQQQQQIAIIQQLQGQSQQIALEQLLSILKSQEENLDHVSKKLNQISVNIQTDENLGQQARLQYEQLQEQIKTLKEELNQLIDQEKQLQQSIDVVTNDRDQQLKIILQPLKENIEHIYKTIVNDNYSQCSLIAENPFINFCGGLIFNAIPHKKAYTLRGNTLSTGETSLANLAFFITLCKIQKSPFIFLDEIDANLDSENINKYISFIQKACQDQQIIFISHKHETFKTAQNLLGITKDHLKNSAVCFSLDLENIYNG